MGSVQQPPGANTFASDDERVWVERFVAFGGTVSDGIAAYRRISRPAPSPAVNPQQIPLLSLVRAPSPTPQAAALPSPSRSTPLPAPALVPKSPKPEQPTPECEQTELDLGELEDQAKLLTPSPTPTQAAELGFVTAAMVFAALPHRAVHDAIYKRKNGDMTLSIMNDPEIGIPYGRYPRLLLAHICTLAKRTGQSRLLLGETQAHFLRQLGLNHDGGGQRGQMALLKLRTIQLLTSAIRLHNSQADKFSFMNMQVADQGSLIWTPHGNSGSVEKYIWQGFIDLSSPFFQQCINHSFPIDFNVIKQLRSSLGIDIYIWLTYRMNHLKKPLRLTWQQLKFQFGSEYANDPVGIRSFKSNFCAQLSTVLRHYDYASVVAEPQYLELRPSNTHIPRVLR